MNGITRYFSPADPPASPPVTPPATPPGAPSATPPATPPAASSYINPDGSYVDKFWEHPAFPADLKDNMQIRTHKGLADTLKNFGSLHKMVGYDKVLIPGKDAKPEVWDEAVWHRLGTPKDAKGYTVPDFKETGLADQHRMPDDLTTKLLDVAHAARMTDWQWQQFTKGWNGLVGEHVKAQDVAAAQTREEAMTPIRQRLGPQYEATRTKLETFLRSRGKPEAFEGLKGLLDNPGAFELLEQIVPAFEEAQADLTLANTPPNVLAQAETEVAKLTASKAYLNEYDAEHVATVARVNELRKMLFAAKAKA